MYEIFYRALGGQVQSKDGLSNLVQRQTGGPTYDPVREAEAERRARELQAIKIGELDEAPQTRAEREALQASGGFYRDEEGAVRDAQGNVQEDFGFDYTAPPEPGRYDPVNTPDTPKWVPPEPEIEPEVLPNLPPGLVRNPDTGEITVDQEASKQWGYEGSRGGWHNVNEDDEVGGDPFWAGRFNEQDFLRNVYMEGYPITERPRGELGGGWSVGRTEKPQWAGNVHAPEHYKYSLQGPSKTFLPTPTPQPTGLQGLGQVMQNPNYIPPSTRPVMNQNMQGFRPVMNQNMQGLGQNMQGFGMQSPRPFGQKVY